MKRFVSPAGRLTPVVRLLCCTLALGLLAGLAGAQSGRRIPKRNPPPAPPAEEAPKEAPPEKDSQAPRVPVMVVTDTRDFQMPTFVISAMREGCLKRLEDAATVSVRAGREMNRKEASDAAKSSQDYVAWLQLTSDRMGMGGYDRYDDLIVSYVLFTPQTGKVRTSGRVYLRPPRGPAGVPLPAPRGSAAYLTESLRQAGEDAAERLLDALK